MSSYITRLVYKDVDDSKPANASVSDDEASKSEFDRVITAEDLDRSVAKARAGIGVYTHETAADFIKFLKEL